MPEFLFEELQHMVKIMDKNNARGFLIGMSIEDYTSLDAFRIHPLAYKILTAPLISMPKYLNDRIPHLRDLAKYRLIINK